MYNYYGATPPDVYFSYNGDGIIFELVFSPLNHSDDDDDDDDVCPSRFSSLRGSLPVPVSRPSATAWVGGGGVGWGEGKRGLG